MNKNVFHMAVQLQSKKANLLMTIEKKFKRLPKFVQVNLWGHSRASVNPVSVF